jgi:hypothetical protein
VIDEVLDSSAETSGELRSGRSTSSPGRYELTFLPEGESKEEEWDITCEAGEVVKAESDRSSDHLRAAQELTGIYEKTALVRLGLQALIACESAKRLAMLGGSEPELIDIPRRRPVNK